MYPYLRMFKELWKFRNAPPLGILDAHISTHRIWPWDLDPWMELNNGRTLTLFDLGRIPLGKRTGLHRVLADKGWGLTVAGNSTRYRRRVTVFQRLTQVSRGIGWDDRFLYIEQSFWRGEECTAHMLLRSAFISKGGMIPPVQVLQALGADTNSPTLPEWVQNWIAADAGRPWPPVRKVRGDHAPYRGDTAG
jgi:acyl-CoA thioesterase FadM